LRLAPLQYRNFDLLTESSKASFKLSVTFSPASKSTSIGFHITLGVAKHANISCNDVNGVSVGLVIL
jgi:hypothetical protein